MNHNAKSIRSFLGSKDFNESRAFYNEIGFEEIIIDPKMSHFVVNENLGFYLQDHYVKDWINNSMVFLETNELETWRNDLVEKDLVEKYKDVKISVLKTQKWAKEFFMHDPSGILWIFGTFKKRTV